MEILFSHCTGMTFDHMVFAGLLKVCLFCLHAVFIHFLVLNYFILYITVDMTG